MSNLLDSASIALTPTAYDNGRMLSVKPIPVYGAELVDSWTNKDFSAFTSSGSTITQMVSSGSGNNCYSLVTFESGKTYKLEFTSSQNITAQIRISNNDSLTGAQVVFSNPVSGLNSVTFTANANYSYIGFYAPVSFTDTQINGFFAKEVLVADGDFDFSRNSAATRVNAQGLVENVQILSGDLVSNGDFSQEGAEEVSNGSFSQEGAEVSSDVNFDNPSNWSLTGQSTVSNGVAHILQDDTSNTGVIANTTITNKTYRITGVVSDYVSGSVGFSSIGSTSPREAIPSQNGEFTIYYTSTRSTPSAWNIQRISSPCNLKIDNVSVKEVGQDWVFGGSGSNKATIGDNSATITSVDGNSYLQQNSVLTSGKNYKISYEIISSSAATNVLKLISSFGISEIPTSVGTHIVYGIAASSTLYIERFINGVNATITNISVKEVGQGWTQTGANWSFGNNKAIADGTSQGSLQHSISTIAVGSKYKINYTISDYVAGNIRLYFGGVFTDFKSSNGSYSQVVTSTSTDGSIATSIATPFNGSITNISVIEITDDTNLPRINYEGFSYQDVLGSELVTNGDFSNGSTDWSVGTNSEINNGSARIYSPSGSYTFVSQSNVLTVGKTYLISLEIVEQNLGEIKLSDGAGYLSNSFSGVGVHTFKATSIGTIFRIQRTASITDISIDNISVKEYFGQEVVPDSGCGSWLLEPQSTNLITYSEDFSDASWTKENVTVQSNTETSPSGQLNASYVIPNIGSGLTPRITYVFSSQSGVTYQASVFVKKFNTDWIRLLSTGATSDTVQAYYDISNGVIGTGGSPNLATIEDYGNGWYRLGLKIASTNISSGATFRVQFAGGDGNPIITTNGTEKFICWGAMLEQQSYATSYIPTNGAASTRLQDIANNSGNATLINSTEGVLYAEIEALTSTQAATIMISISNGSTNAIKFGYQQGANVFFVESTGTANGIGIYSEPINPLTYSKVALSYKENDVKLYINGVLEAIDTSFTAFAPDILNTLNFDSGTGASKFHGKVKALVVYKEALTDEQLTCLTTI